VVSWRLPRDLSNAIFCQYGAYLFDAFLDVIREHNDLVVIDHFFDLVQKESKGL